MEEKNILEVKHCNCKDCGKEFIITPAEQKFYINKGYYLPKRCEECRTKKKETTIVTCVDCGKDFTITKDQEIYFKNHELELPKRCNECRSYKKERNQKISAE